MKRIIFALSIGFTFLLASCGGSGNGIMNAEELEVEAEKRFNTELETLSADLDEQCETQFEAMVARVTDSIVEAQIAAE